MSDLPVTEQHYVYIVECANGSLYTGYSKNVEQRVAAHNSGKGGRYTRAHRPVALLACCQFRSKSEALRVEYSIKQLPRSKKLRFIKNIAQPSQVMNPRAFEEKVTEFDDQILDNQEKEAYSDRKDIGIGSPTNVQTHILSEQNV
jgi:putative endonuclease